MCNGTSSDSLLVNWPFANDAQVHGMKLPDYLAWAAGDGEFNKKLLLPPIQRGFVWKPKQIVDLWDSLLRGMPIGSLMVSKLSEGQEGSDLINKNTEKISSEALGLLDGQQRTLAMLIGYPYLEQEPNSHCLWIDLAEEGHSGAPFEIRLTTKAQPFGFQRIAHSRLSRYERRMARKKYDDCHSENKSNPDYALFNLAGEREQPRPWKVESKTALFVRIKELWQGFKETENNESAFLERFRAHLGTSNADVRLSSLHKAFARLESLEVPLILIPDHIGTPQLDLANGAPDPLVLLFERIGRNGASLSAEDLLFSMIKQQWPQAQNLVNEIHEQPSVRAFMGATDYVMTAFRLAAAQSGIADNPRPNPNDFHRHLGSLLGKEGETNAPLRDYLKERTLSSAFECLFDVLSYRKIEQDIGLPTLMMPHLSRGLIQVLLRWVMLNSDPRIIEANRNKIISFCLFWYMNVWHEDKAGKKAFEILENIGQGVFPASELYNELIDAPDDELGLALPLMSAEDLNNILIQKASASFQSNDAIFERNSDGYIATFKQRELYKRFCWSRKPILLWLQRAYVHQQFDEHALAQFAGLTDEDTVPYDYDHLCPESHWGADWRNIIKIADESSSLMKDFRDGRNGVGNCIGNLHVLESSLNRSFGDSPLGLKLKSEKWCHKNSLLYTLPEHEKLWEIASPYFDDDVDGKNGRTWSETRLQAFQSAVYGRARGLYREYFDACKHVVA